TTLWAIMVYILQNRTMEQRIVEFYLYTSFLISGDLILFKLPCSYKIKEDRVNKLIAICQPTVDIIIASLLGVKEGICTSTNTAFTDGTERNKFYISHSSDSTSLPPFIIEFQHMITKNFIFTLIPILLMFCINQVEFKALTDQFKFNFRRSYFLETPSNHSAQYCYILTTESITSDVDNVNEDMNPIITFANLLLSGQQSIVGINRKNDPIILKIYSISKDIMIDSISTEMKGIQDLSTLNRQVTKNFSQLPSFFPLDHPPSFVLSITLLKQERLIQ
ncbi:hypothetical protein CU098_004512, partial [Rhizopus stolonifer]